MLHTQRYLAGGRVLRHCLIMKAPMAGTTSHSRFYTGGVMRQCLKDILVYRRRSISETPFRLMEQ
jgi:hypothetical protein